MLQHVRSISENAIGAFRVVGNAWDWFGQGSSVEEVTGDQDHPEDGICRRSEEWKSHAAVALTVGVTAIEVEEHKECACGALTERGVFIVL